MEEEVVESHKNLEDKWRHWMDEDMGLLALSCEFDHSQDAYAQQLEGGLNS